jgi:hypothetical protein
MTMRPARSSSTISWVVEMGMGDSSITDRLVRKSAILKDLPALGRIPAGGGRL